MSENPQETPKEEPKVERTEENSVLIKDIVVAIARTEQGPAILITPVNRQELIMAKGEMEFAIIRTLAILEKKAEEKRSGIIQPKGNIMNFARKRFKS